MIQFPAELPTFSLCLAALLFLAKQLVADFLLQTSWMALGKERAESWIKPLAVHAAIHAIGTLLLCLSMAPALVWFAAVDFFVHGTIDRCKGLATRRLAATPATTAFWWLLGIDQALHGLTHLVFVLWIAAAHAPV